MLLTTQQWAAAALMIVVVLRISWVDGKTFRIPDIWNLLLFGLGLMYLLPFGVDHAFRSVLAAVGVVLLLILFRYSYFRSTGRVGLGFGDVKFAANAALWFSPWSLPLFFLLASSSALVFSVFSLRGQRTSLRTARIPFGPFLGLALILIWSFEVISPFSLGP